MKIIYHASCADGFCAAFILSKIPVYEDADFLPFQYVDSTDSLFKEDGEACIVGDNVIIADFSFDRQIMLDIKSFAKSVICYDHRKTAEEALKGLDFCIFDMAKSGARLVYENEYLLRKRNMAFDGLIKFLVDYTEDRDLWRWKLPQSREVSAGIASWPFDFDVWGGFYEGALKQDGAAILRYQQAIIDKAVYSAKEIGLGGKKGLVTGSSILQSEIGECLAGKADFGAICFIVDDGIVFSLRSQGVDVSEIAKGFGGGGHKKSAGFKLPFHDAARMLGE